jgi:hypothetical protein
MQGDVEFGEFGTRAAGESRVADVGIYFGGQLPADTAGAQGMMIYVAGNHDSAVGDAAAHKINSAALGSSNLPHSITYFPLSGDFKLGH